MKRIIVDCKYNDPVDVRCRGPRMLGFDFYVQDEDVERVTSFIQAKLVEFGRPLLDIRACDAPVNAMESSEEFITKCIIEGY